MHVGVGANDRESVRARSLEDEIRETRGLVRVGAVDAFDFAAAASEFIEVRVRAVVRGRDIAPAAARRLHRTCDALGIT